MENSTTTIRFNDNDRALLADLMRQTGLTSRAEVVRMGLRALAEKLAGK